MLFQFRVDFYKIRVGSRHVFFQGLVSGLSCIFRNTIIIGPFFRSFYRYLLRSSNPGYDIFTLSIDQILTVKSTLTG